MTQSAPPLHPTYTHCKPVLQRMRYSRCPVLLLLPLCMLLCGLVLATHSQASLRDTSYERTLELFRQVPEISDQETAAYEPQLRALSYTNMRAFRAFCTLPGITPTQSIEALQHLAGKKIQFEHIPLLEHLVTLQGTTLSECRHLIDRLKETGFVAGRVIASLANVQNASAPVFFDFMSHVEKLDEAGQWAAKSLFEITGVTADTVQIGLNLLERMQEQQRWAAEKLCAIPGLEADAAVPALKLLLALSDTDAGNMRALFMHADIDTAKANTWLLGYFKSPLNEREKYYCKLTAQEKSVLLAAFSNAANTFIWQINNLHDVTDSFGREIGSGALARYSLNGLALLFHRLPRGVRERHQEEMQGAIEAGDRTTAVSTLRQATATARKQTARDLSSANIYVLLAHGSELYDSSFRNILVPVLKKRITTAYSNDLLPFLLQTDPDSLYISDFITSLAQKGKLTLFLPGDVNRQRQVLDLVACSALHDEHSLILFSATFSRLLQALQPQARSYLIGLLLQSIRAENTVFTTQLRVILQYYLEKHPKLLSAQDRQNILLLLKERGRIDLSRFSKAPFSQWKEDGLLTSLSVFQDDDDGRSSYISNCSTLLAHGYRPGLSRQYVVSELSTASQSEVARVLSAVCGRPTDSLLRIFRIAARYPLVIDWQKEVNDIQIIHSVYVYQGKGPQQLLLEQFLTRGHEMFAQRGHSYWRFEQLFEPLETLLELKKIDERDLLAKQRFLSIGSCGGIRAYTRLNQLFKSSVDILATIGTGKSAINNPYNQQFFEIIAGSRNTLTWQEIEKHSAEIFAANLGEDYLQPGSLPAILHKMMDTGKPRYDTDKT